MSLQDNKYVEAAQNDFDTLKQKWSDLREAWSKSSNEGGDQAKSSLAETAWNDFQVQSEKLRAAGSKASDEMRDAYEAARDKVKHHLES